MSMKMFNGNNLPKRTIINNKTKTEAKNAFENNMSTDIKLK